MGFVVHKSELLDVLYNDEIWLNGAVNVLHALSSNKAKSKITFTEENAKDIEFCYQYVNNRHKSLPVSYQEKMFEILKREEVLNYIWTRIVKNLGGPSSEESAL